MRSNHKNTTNCHVHTLLYIFYVFLLLKIYIHLPVHITKAIVLNFNWFLLYASRLKHLFKSNLCDCWDGRVEKLNAERNCFEIIIILWGKITNNSIINNKQRRLLFPKQIRIQNKTKLQKINKNKIKKNKIKRKK